MNSARPGNRHTVPLRPGGGAQRAKRSDTPSGVFSIPLTTSSGTGLAGSETRSMREYPDPDVRMPPRHAPIRTSESERHYQLNESGVVLDFTFPHDFAAG